jgi:hypothetical protein
MSLLHRNASRLSLIWECLCLQRPAAMRTIGEFTFPGDLQCMHAEWAMVGPVLIAFRADAHDKVCAGQDFVICAKTDQKSTVSVFADQEFFQAGNLLQAGRSRTLRKAGAGLEFSSWLRVPDFISSHRAPSHQTHSAGEVETSPLARCRRDRPA